MVVTGTFSLVDEGINEPENTQVVIDTDWYVFTSAYRGISRSFREVELFILVEVVAGLKKFHWEKPSPSLKDFSGYTNDNYFDEDSLLVNG